MQPPTSWYCPASTASFGWPSGRTAASTPAALKGSAPALPAEPHTRLPRGLRASFGLFIDEKETGETGNAWAISRLTVCLVSG